MITKNQIKFIQSLQQKKYRQLHQFFIVEGAKNVLELLDSTYSIHTIYATQTFHKENINALDKQNQKLDFMQIFLYAFKKH